MATPNPKLKGRRNYIYLRRECEREREGWPPPFLLLFLTGMGIWPTPKRYWMDKIRLEEAKVLDTATPYIGPSLSRKMD